MDLFKLQSLNPRSHVVLNSGISSIVFRSEEMWECILVCDLLNQIEFCNSRIALLGNLTIPQGTWKFITEYYRVTRFQALNVVTAIGGGSPIEYCKVCEGLARQVQASHKHKFGYFICDYHKEQFIAEDRALNNDFERVW